MSTYEFNQEESMDILKLAQYMKITAILVIVFGILAIVFSLLSVDIISVFYFVFFIIAGISFYLPTDNFTRVAKTKGSDIKELMDGFKELIKFWNIVIVLLIVLLGLELFLW